MLIPRSGAESGTPTSFSAWTSPQPVENIITVARYATTVWIEWQPADTRRGEVPDQYVITNAEDDSERYFTYDTNLQIVLGKGKRCKLLELKSLPWEGLRLGKPNPVRVI